jgi:hypothetical protein
VLTKTHRPQAAQPVIETEEVPDTVRCFGVQTVNDCFVIICLRCFCFSFHAKKAVDFKSFLVIFLPFMNVNMNYNTAPVASSDSLYVRDYLHGS